MRIRWQFDAGAGVCLWADDDEARERYDYPIEFQRLPITRRLAEEGEALLRRFDQSIDWSDPGGASPWSEQERERFHADCADYRDRLRRELQGHGIELAEPERR